MSKHDRSDMPLFQKVGGSTHWRHTQPEKKATQ